MGRTYSMIHSQTWVDPRIKKMSAEANLLRIYLMSNHYANGAGYYVFKLAYGSEDLPMTKNKVIKAMNELEQRGFIMYNPETYSLLILDWFDHHSLSSHTTANHIIKLAKTRILPQHDPEMDAVMNDLLIKSSIAYHDKPKHAKFFEFLASRTELPEILKDAVERNRVSPIGRCAKYPDTEADNSKNTGDDEENPFSGSFN